MRFETVLYDAADGIATISLNQPDSRNALSDALLDDLLGAFEEARVADDVRCVVLASTHPTTSRQRWTSGGPSPAST